MSWEEAVCPLCVTKSSGGYGGSRLTTDGTREKASQADLFVPVNWVSVDLWNSARSPEVGGVQ